VRQLQKEGFDVHCVLTRAGRQFVAPQALAAISKNPVLKNEYFSEALSPRTLANTDFSHIELTQKIDLLLIAPATADTIARLTGGRANGLFETIAMSTKVPILLAPAMNTNMLESKITQKNIDILKKYGFQILPTESGKLACGEIGFGRLLPVTEIILYAKRAIYKQTLARKTVLITLGRTEEPLDPVRVLTNTSSGKMGIALAKEAFFRGAEVHVISGKISEAIPSIFSSCTKVQTAKQIKQQVLEKMHELEKLQKKREVEEAEQEVDQLLA